MIYVCMECGSMDFTEFGSYVERYSFNKETLDCESEDKDIDSDSLECSDCDGYDLDNIENYLDWDSNKKDFTDEAKKILLQIYEAKGLDRIKVVEKLKMLDKVKNG